MCHSSILEKNKTILQRKPNFWFASDASSKGQTIFFFEWLGAEQFPKQNSCTAEEAEKALCHKEKKMSKRFLLSTSGPVFDFKKFVHVKLLPTKKETCTILR